MLTVDRQTAAQFTIQQLKPSLQIFFFLTTQHTVAELNSCQKSLLLLWAIVLGALMLQLGWQEGHLAYKKLLIILSGPKKRPELSHGVMQQSRWNESAEKHVCNEQTSSKMCMNFHLKHFHISRDTSEIVLHVTKQCLQAVRHFCCWLYAGYTRTPQ